MKHRLIITQIEVGVIVIAPLIKGAYYSTLQTLQAIAAH